LSLAVAVLVLLAAVVVVQEATERQVALEYLLALQLQ
jgi:hypothetical protein